MIPMSVKTIRATIIDIRRDTPTAQDELFVDTNSWRELTYTRIQNPKTDYIAYMKRALGNGVKFLACGINLMELASTIERDEWSIFRASTAGATNLKIFRHDYPDQRKHVVSQVRASWDQITQVARLVDLNLNAHIVGRCVQNF